MSSNRLQKPRINLFIDAFGAVRELTNIVGMIAKTIVSPPDPARVDNIPARLAATAARIPNKTAIIFEGRQITFGELDEMASRIAAALRSQGIERGDSVSLMAENSIEFVALLMGSLRAGAKVALINTNLQGKQLAHCVTTPDAKKLIFSSDSEPAVASAKSQFGLDEPSDFLWVGTDANATVPNWAIDFSARYAGCEPISAAAVPRVQPQEHALYVFTSGTTGMPKAAILPHSKITSIMDLQSKILLKVRQDDIIYLCLPLYHGTGLALGLGPAIQVGATVVLRRKFSASRFLDEVREHNCNAFVYIGELCRYLLAQPERADDGDNPLCKMAGSGLRPDIWMDFKQRFQIERISESYGASEGNAGLMNIFNRDCTIGTSLTPTALVKYDVNLDEVVRDENGRCLQVASGEPGLLLGPITKSTAFDGYTDREATDKKILRDVFEEGDAYFDSGDLIRQVDAGFAFGFKHYQFVDRVGDSFRWKGENCSTNEVGEIINGHPSVQICNVYGVEIPGADGRAGMAALVPYPDGAIDIEGISALVMSQLVSYARPVFLRILSAQPLTGTFKMQKGELREAAYGPGNTDPLYVMLPGNSRYEQLTAEIYRKIQAGDAGF